MSACPRLLARLPLGLRIRVVGDLMLDRFVRGSIPRQSPEAPVPILLDESRTDSPGGAGVVAAQLARLGAAVSLEAVVGEDEAGAALLAGLARARVPATGVRRLPGGKTVTKTRYIGDGNHLLRVDSEAPPGTVKPLALEVGSEAAVAVSDYGKGALDDTLPEFLAAARRAGVPTVVDPKPPHRERYRGGGVLTPNRAEAGVLLGQEVAASGAAEAGAARELATSLGVGACVLTLGDRGMAWHQGGQEGALPAARVHTLFDVTGAGDIVVAFLAAGLARGEGIGEAAALANGAAGVSVGRPDTAILSPGDLGTLLGEAPAGVELPQADAVARVASWRAAGESVVFTNGCFDGLHAGHLCLLAAAAAEGDRLVVAINSDASVRALKGSGRPENAAAARAALLLDLPFVDMVVVFAEETPALLLAALGPPDVLVKGGDWEPDAIVGGKETREAGGRVLSLPLLEGHATSGFVG